ncbi:hypothetical protein SAMN05192552_102925 [Natrinema hispanicum]|uniref:Uncharacterized protein n=1 Tax=Natrinema hispanicum TaxID=392421 RepID=A0A1I0I8D4_9EURY|nr:hypothetical protein SAMN05192552_102925 [Natrinema hispanicum]SET92816.1 hypothetical protein SAMN04488694_11755 [Natrinema hispanicum]
MSDDFRKVRGTANDQSASVVTACAASDISRIEDRVIRLRQGHTGGWDLVFDNNRDGRPKPILYNFVTLVPMPSTRRSILATCTTGIGALAGCISTEKPTADGSWPRRTLIDILLRVYAEESRAVGVSGLQPWTPPLHGSSRLTQPSWPVADRRSRERSSRAAHQKSSISEDGAKPPLLLSSASLTPSCCFCQQGVVDALTYLELSSGLLRLTGTGTNPSRIRVHHVGVSNTVSLGWRVDRLRRLFGIRSVPT